MAESHNSRIDVIKAKAASILELIKEIDNDISLMQFLQELRGLRKGEADPVMKVILEAIPLPIFLERIASHESYFQQYTYLQLLVFAVNIRPIAVSCAKVDGIWDILSDIFNQNCYESDEVPTHMSGTTEEVIMTNRNHRIQEAVFGVVGSLVRHMNKEKAKEFVFIGFFDECVAIASEKVDFLHNALNHIAILLLAITKNDPEVVERMKDSGYEVEITKEQALGIYAGLKKEKQSSAARNTCNSCGKRLGQKLKACERCRSVFFCDRKCFKKAWKTHKKTCKQLKMRSLE